MKYCLLEGTRMIQNLQNLKKSEFTVYNAKLDEELIVSTRAATILRNAYKHDNIDCIEKLPYANMLFGELKNAGFIVERTTEMNTFSGVYLAPKCKLKYPLTAFNIELTNTCNLNCKHCYGGFPDSKEKIFVPYLWIKSNLDLFNKMHIRRIGLTGGEPTLHPDFVEIVLFFLKNGFEVCVFSNGYNFNIIENLLKVSRDFRYKIKISLDGLENIHNRIRGNVYAYENAIKSIAEVNKYKNVTLFVSTTIMRDNITDIPQLESVIKSRFPEIIHTKDLIFPLGTAADCSYCVEDFPSVFRSIPSVFFGKSTHIAEDNDEPNSRKLRCSGGVSQCTLMPDGRLKICNGASDKQFYFKYNAFQKGLIYAWCNCGNNVSAFRNERYHNTYDCLRCKMRVSCNRIDCRVLAFGYTGSCKRSSPLTCYVEKHIRTPQML